MTRVRTYVQNLGLLPAMFNALVLAGFIYLVIYINMGTARLAISLGICLAAFVLPLALTPLMLRDLSATSRAIRWLNWMLIAIVVLVVTKAVRLTPESGPFVLAAVSLMHGSLFWFFSNPQVMTLKRAAARMQRRMNDDHNNRADPFGA